ncbi:MAG: hypothetical protein FJ000_00655 [Actinobacteria bacterium]|nr:hypothetical protein [Actinomycetota bacterium]
MDTAAQVLNWVAWLGVAVFAVWLIWDAARVESTYDNELLVSSVEGLIEQEILIHPDEMKALEKEMAAEPDSEPDKGGD